MILTYVTAECGVVQRDEPTAREERVADQPSLTNAYGTARVSRQRLLIADTASAMGSAFTVDDLVAAVRRADPATGLATVYRAVGALEAAGTVARVGERLGSALFVYCVADGHHHHLVCTGCGRVEHAPCPIGEESLAPAERNGFTVTGHEVTLFGLCPECVKVEAD